MGVLSSERGDRLAGYACRVETSRGRRRAERDHPYRSAFQRDRDRVVHTAAFRRMEHKTQVFASGEGDHYRTRLTHTLEATQVARTLARALGLEEDLTEAIALAHDLGHAPFGHAGGEALAEVMRDRGGFEHNRQSLRVVDLLERHRPRSRGLNLTYEVREALIKHGVDPSTEREPDARPPAPELSEYHPEEAPPLEAQLVDHCDGIAYDAHDLDDGLRAGILELDDVRTLALWRAAEAQARKRHGEPQDPETWRRAVTRRLIDILASDLFEATQKRLEERGIDSLGAVREAREFLCRPGPARQEDRAALRRFLFHELYRHHRVMRLWRVAKDGLSRLFRVYVEEPRLLHPRWQRWCDQVGPERGVCDYIAGMTDRFCAREVRRLSTPDGSFWQGGTP